MPIRHFDFFCSERLLLGSESLSLLKDCRIGIEGNYWLRKVLKPQNPASKDLDQILASVVAMGGSPPYETLSALISKELDHFKAYNITPFFVFNGLAVKRDKPFSSEDFRPSKRDMAWQAYENKRYDAAQDSWLKSNSLNQTDYMQLIFKILNEAKVEFMRAPYSVWGQLTYLDQHPDQLVHAVYAGSEMLMWNVDRVILSFDFDRGSFSFLDKPKVLQDLGGISPDTFLEIAILAGFDWIATFPPLASNFAFKNAVDFAMTNSVLAFADHPAVAQSGYLDLYFKVRAIVRHHLVLGDDGQVQPLNHSSAPNDMHILLGSRLPDSLYNYMCHGMISPQVINSILSGFIVESHPLCSGYSEEYRSFIKCEVLLNARAKAIAILTAHLNRYFSSYLVNVVNWFEKDAENPVPTLQLPVQWLNNAVCQFLISSSQPTSGKAHVLSLSQTSSWIAEAKKKQRAEAVDVKLCLKTIQAFAKVANGGKDVSAISPGILQTRHVATTPQEITGLVLARFLEIQGYIKCDSINLEPRGTVMLRALLSSTMQQENQEELLTVFEMVAMGCLYKPVRGTRTERDHVWLISSIMSILPIHSNAMHPFPGVFSKELLEYNSYVKVVNRSMRNIFEMILLAYTFEIERYPEASFIEIGFKNMYFSDAGCAMGLLGQSYFALLAEKGSVEEAFAAADAKFSDYCSGGFNLQFQRGVTFWRLVVEAIAGLAGIDAFDKDCLMAFYEAEAWFKDQRGRERKETS